MLTIFSTPKPFRGHIDVIQRNALKSWKLLHPDAEVILFGDDEGTADVCRELALRHEPQVLRSDRGTKRLDFIFARAQELAHYDLLCYVNCDIILTADFFLALTRLLEWRPSFLMVGRRWDTDITQLLDFSRPSWQAEIIARARAEGCQRFFHNIDYFAFPRGLYTEIPPLAIGRVGWDHWLVWKAGASGVAVVDVSEAVCAVHQNHDYAYHPEGIEGVWHDEEARRNNELAGGSGRAQTIEDAAFRLTSTSLRPNRFRRLAPAKRRWRDVSRAVRGFVRTRVWHPVLDATRPLRRAIGLNKDAVPAALRRTQRRHWMDQ